MENVRLVLFDGVCNYCNNTINFFIRNDPNNLLKFATIQSETGQKRLSKFNVNSKDDSIVFIDKGTVTTHATAIFNICKYLNWPVKVFYLLGFIPSFISNPIYKCIARNRYKWFGKKEQCMIPTDDIKNRFLD